LMQEDERAQGLDIMDLDGDVARGESTGEAVRKGEDVDAPLR
jgi:hypothetical protein